MIRTEDDIVLGISDLLYKQEVLAAMVIYCLYYFYTLPERLKFRIIMN